MPTKVTRAIRKYVSIESEDDDIIEEYDVAEEKCPLTYFNTNKIHSLRAKYIYGDKDAPEFYAEFEAVIKHKKKVG